MPRYHGTSPYLLVTHAVAGDAAQARDCTDQALAAAEDIAEDEERDLVLADLETVPGQPRYW